MLSRLGRELRVMGQRYNGLKSLLTLLESPALKTFCQTSFDCERISSEVLHNFLNTSKPLADRVNEANTITAPIDNFILRSMYWDFAFPSLKVRLCPVFHATPLPRFAPHLLTYSGSHRRRRPTDARTRSSRG